MTDSGQSKKSKFDFDNSIISKKMLIIAFTAPFLFGVIAIIIAFFATVNFSELVRAISLVTAAFLGLGLSIIIIFLMQRNINKKLRKKQDENQ